MPGSEGLAVTPDGRQLVVATPKLALGGEPAAPPALTVIDTATGQPALSVRLDAPAVPVHITATGLVLAGEVHLAPNSGAGPVPVDGRLRILAPGSYDSLASIPVGQVPLTIHSSPDGTRAYVANTASDTVTVVDLVDLRVLAVVAVSEQADAGPHGIAHLPAHP
ncbi:YncE family protein [Kitasatospora sp. NPDC054939]